MGRKLAIAAVSLGISGCGGSGEVLKVTGQDGEQAEMTRVYDKGYINGQDTFVMSLSDVPESAEAKSKICADVPNLPVTASLTTVENHSNPYGPDGNRVMVVCAAAGSLAMPTK